MRRGATVTSVARMRLPRHGERSEATRRNLDAAGSPRFWPCSCGLALTAALLLAAPAQAAPRSIDDCESIKEPNAYNLCLASFGPMRGQHGATYPGVASEGEKGGGTGSAVGRAVTAAGAARHAIPRGYNAKVAHRSGGRVRMEFTPGRR